MSKKEKKNLFKNIKSKNLLVDGKINLEQFQDSNKIKETFFNKDKVESLESLEGLNKLEKELIEKLKVVREKKKSFKKIGILGGSFNPIHKRHLEIVNSLLTKFKVDEVWLLIAYQKENSGGEATKTIHRLKMIELALKEENLEKLVKISYSEIDKKKFVPTVETLKELNEQNPNKSFIFAFGSDHVPSFTKWDNIKEIKKYAKLVCYERKGIHLSEENKKLLQHFPCELVPTNPPDVSVSSTDIRNGLKLNYLSSSVLEYIRNQKLYEIKE